MPLWPRPPDETAPPDLDEISRAVHAFGRGRLPDWEAGHLGAMRWTGGRATPAGEAPFSLAPDTWAELAVPFQAAPGLLRITLHAEPLRVPRERVPARGTAAGSGSRSNSSGSAADGARGQGFGVVTGAERARGRATMVSTLPSRHTLSSRGWFTGCAQSRPVEASTSATRSPLTRMMTSPTRSPADSAGPAGETPATPIPPS